MVAVDEMVAGSEGDEMRVVGRRRDRHRPRAADVGVAELQNDTTPLPGGSQVHRLLTRLSTPELQREVPEGSNGGGMAAKRLGMRSLQNGQAITGTRP